MCPYLEFGGYEHCSGANKLQHLPVDWSLGQVVVCHLYSQVEGLVVKLKVLLNKRINRASIRHGATNTNQRYWFRPEGEIQQENQHILFRCKLIS